MARHGLALALAIAIHHPLAFPDEPPALPAWELPFDVWQRPRTASYVLAQEPIRAAVQSWIGRLERDPQAILVIQHPGGEDGTVWAAELRDWLVALAVPGSAIELRPGGVAEDKLLLSIESP
ncbi:MAG: hypothetical protein H6981_08475 [Gammaproteobacteria bacterium]|nr:hypothetical protein [Gammaproteobacteria bacterium]MCP5136822.1 hypothetical protein [Gammaproteobacteria bacterium]